MSENYNINAFITLFPITHLVPDTGIVWLLDAASCFGGYEHEADLLDVSVVVVLVVLGEVLVLPAHHLQHAQALLGRHVSQALAGVR